jgi:ADP-heptose:LPS heptosyltransferase
MFSPRRILLIQLRAIGDVILTTPAIRVLRRRFPEARIDFLANAAPAEALENNPHLNEVLIYPYSPNDAAGLLRQGLKLRQKRYDVVIDFLGTAATALLTRFSGAPVRVGYRLRFRRILYTHHEIGYRGDIYNALTKFSLLRPLGIQDEELAPEMFVPAEAEGWAKEYFYRTGLANQSVIALAPQAKRLRRRWPGDGFAAVANWLQDQEHRIILIWAPGEREYVESVAKMISPEPAISPQTSLMQSAALMKRCRLLVCNCGGAKHVAVAVGTPTFTIHGPTDPRVWTPPNDPRHAFVRSATERTEDVAAEQVIQGIRAMQIP